MGFFFPYLTASPVVVLTAIFVFELHVSATSGSTRTIDASAYVSLGGLGRALLLQQHEWWRCFTAPWHVESEMTYLKSRSYCR